MLDSTSVRSSTLPPRWARWIVENKVQGLDDHRIAAILRANGFDESSSWDGVCRLDDATVNLDVAIRNAQRLKKLESIFDAIESMRCLTPDTETVCRREGLSREDFLAEYYSANKPVILTDQLHHWRALQVWTPEYLKSKCGDAVVEVMVGRNNDPAYEINMESHKTTIRFADFVDRVFSAHETNDFYLTGNNHFLKNSAVHVLLDDIALNDTYLRPEIPGHSFLWFGPRGAVTQPHHDEMNILMSQVLGRKSVCLVSPTQTHLLYNNVGVYSDVDWDNPDYERHPRFRRVKMITVVLSPGESLFLPVGWWHHVKSLDPSLSISFSNFVYDNDFYYQHPEIRED
jgi:hypothetical protein